MSRDCQKLRSAAFTPELPIRTFGNEVQESMLQSSESSVYSQRRSLKEKVSVMKKYTKAEAVKIWKIEDSLQMWENFFFVIMYATYTESSELRFVFFFKRLFYCIGRERETDCWFRQIVFLMVHSQNEDKMCPLHLGAESWFWIKSGTWRCIPGRNPGSGSIDSASQGQH